MKFLKATWVRLIWTLMNYLRLLMEAGQRDVEPELIYDRQDLWLTYPATSPPWMTLRTHVELYDYKKLLMDDLGIDNRALDSFVDLVRTKPYGYNEACRVLHHLLKDHFEQTWSSSASRWVYKSCTLSQWRPSRTSRTGTMAPRMHTLQRASGAGQRRAVVARVPRVPLEPGAITSLRV